ncbi:MAG: methyltransferase [Desulfomonile tiedjei]|nr:methyltransferase [Desulfomonile tiedjei]
MARELTAAGTSKPLRVLEIGAGIGTMVERLLDWGLVTRATYTALDSEPENIAEAARRLPEWGKDHEYTVETAAAGSIRLRRGEADVLVTLQVADVFDFMATVKGSGDWDLLIANAFLDLVDIPSALPDLLALLRPAGFFYFTINFDGGTIFQPELDPLLDGQIEELYHDTMDRRIIRGKPSGDSRTGRHFFQHARSAGAHILAAGASDWVVFAGPDGYHGDEAYFLHFLVHTVGLALAGHPDLDARALSDWVEQRHRQIEQGILVYIAHQLDFFGRK